MIDQQAQGNRAEKIGWIDARAHRSRPSSRPSHADFIVLLLGRALLLLADPAAKASREGDLPARFG